MPHRQPLELEVAQKRLVHQSLRRHRGPRRPLHPHAVDNREGDVRLKPDLGEDIHMACGEVDILGSAGTSEADRDTLDTLEEACGVAACRREAELPRTL